MEITTAPIGNNSDTMLNVIGFQIDPLAQERHGYGIQVYNLTENLDMSSVYAKTCSLKKACSSILRNLTLAKRLNVIHIVGYENNTENDSALMALLSDTQVKYKDVKFTFWLGDFGNIPSILDPYQNRSHLTDVDGGQ